MNDRLSPAEEVFQELQQARRIIRGMEERLVDARDLREQLTNAMQAVATLGAAYDHVCQRLCAICKVGDHTYCSEHQSAAGIIAAVYRDSTPSKPKESEHEVLMWDWRESVDVDELAQAVGRLSRGMLRIHTVETGTDANGIVITNNSAMTPERAQQLFEEDSPVLPYANGLIDIVKVDGVDRWSLTCSMCGDLGTWPMVPITSRSEPEVAWDTHVDKVHDGHGNY